MAQPQLADLVLETANAPGTGPIVLGGAPDGRQTYADTFPAGGEVYYYASDGQQTEWGVGTLTLGSPNMLARTAVMGNLSGTKTTLNFTQNITVWCEIPAEKCLQLNEDGSFSVRPDTDYTKDEALSAKSADSRYAKAADVLADTLQLTSATSQTVASAVVFSGEVSVPNPSDIPGSSTGNHAASTYWTDSNFAKLNGPNTLQGRQIFTNGLETGPATPVKLISADTGTFSQLYIGQDNALTMDIDRVADGSNISWLRLRQDGTLGTNRGDAAVTSQLPFSDPSLKIQVFQIYYNGGKQVVSLPTAFSRLLFVSASPIDSTAPVQCSAVDQSETYPSGASFALNAWWAGGAKGFNWTWQGNIYIFAVGQY